MIRITYKYDEAGVTFQSGGTAPGLFRRLSRRKPETAKGVDGWVENDIARCDALGALRSYGEDHPGTVRFEETRIVAMHAAVASLGAGQARALGLPAPPPFVLATDTSGVIGSPDFRLTAHWLDAGGPTPTRRRGAFLETSKGEFLIPEPMFSAVELADAFDAGTVELPDHWTALAQFRRLLDPDTAGRVRIEMSEFLRGLRIYTGAALSLTLSGGGDDVEFDPVLFDEEALNAAREQGRPLSECDGMLPGNLLRTFQKDPRTGFRAFDAAKRSYLLGGNTYLIADEDLEVILQVVREKQQAGPAERRAFAANPRAEIAERLAEKANDGGAKAEQAADDTCDEDIEARTELLFVETPEYADRAFGIGLWERPNLDFLPHTPNVWLPETFALELGGVWVRLSPDAVRDLRTLVDEAIEAGRPHVDYRGERIPATLKVRDKLTHVVGTERPAALPNEEMSGPDKGDGREPSSPTVILVYQNFVDENWSPSDASRETPTAKADVPRAVRSELLPHQRDALKWQIDAWRAGYPGVLNADDQGLGKTLQTLAFLAWLQAGMSKESCTSVRRPVLIVAPTGLLRTWQAEEQRHLTGMRLGVCVEAFGSEIRKLRRPGCSGRDTDDGEPRLDFKALQAAIGNGNGHQWWVLTTYETLASYQHSFRQIHFSVVVFDEVQKTKNVRTLMALAARGVKATFRIGLTGTPIENHVGDLWAIMDAVAPGRLGALRGYLERYGHVTEENMRELHGRLFKPLKSRGKVYPPIGQRRLKEKEIADLPRKDYRLHPATMPAAQAQAYEQARNHLTDGARGATLKLLHHIRGVSLHPEAPDAAAGEIDTYFAHSARFESVRAILTHIHGRGERLLIFTEDRRVQGLVAQWLRSAFGLAAVRIINGATTIAKRRQYVSEFQEHLHNGDGGFDVMILSPRAAGVGLTLTAATHVIHLSRWWNPAVEEQCNDRIFRIGQTRDVTVHLPLAVHPAYRESSFDCVLNDLMRRKSSLAHAALWPPTNSDFDNGMLVTGVNGAEPFDPVTVDDLDWSGFEHWVLDRARESGDWDASGTPPSGDSGADAMLRHRRRRSSTALVQVKHTTDRDRRIGDSAVRELLGAVERYEVCRPKLVVITNACDFTQRARELAIERDVALVDRDRLGLWPNHVLG